MNALLLINEKYEGFSPVEQRIADYILDHEGGILEMSIQELAEKSGTSPAGVVRFSRRLGLTGFPQLKQQISVAIASMDRSSDFQEVSENEEVAVIKTKLKARLINMVEQTNSCLSDKNIDEVSKKLDLARVIFVYGIGASSLVAQDIFHKFTRIGKFVYFSQDLHLISASMVSLKFQALFIAISNSGETSDLLALAKVAKKNEIPIVAITGKIESSLAEAAEVVLLSTSGESFAVRTAATMSLMAQLYVVDILYYAYLSSHFDESLKGIQATREIISEIEN